jgi:hypothetical protein
LLQLKIFLATYTLRRAAFTPLQPPDHQTRTKITGTITGEAG